MQHGSGGFSRVTAKMSGWLLPLRVRDDRIDKGSIDGMARTRRKGQGRDSGGAVPRKMRLAPDRWLAGLAGAGVLLTAYLFFAHFSGAGALFCTAGSSCDIVQESRWSILFGLPLSLWGLGLYLLLLLAACTGTTVATRWRRVFSLSLIGVLMSLYLTTVGWVALEAVCAWCLTSFGLLLAIFGLLLWRRPAQTPASGWPRWLALHAIVLLPALGVIAVAQAGWLSPPDDPRLAPLAQHLRDTQVKLYGTFWCPNCQQQKRLFGQSADALPYVECSPNGRNGTVALECVSAGIESYPTWVIRGERVTGVLAPGELARRTRFHKWNASAAADAGAAQQ